MYAIAGTVYMYMYTDDFVIIQHSITLILKTFLKRVKQMYNYWHMILQMNQIWRFVFFKAIFKLI